MSGASRRGYQRGRNRPFGGRGGTSFGRGAREQSRGRTDTSRVGEETRFEFPTDQGRGRGPRGGSSGRTRGKSRGGKTDRNEGNKVQGRGRGSQGWQRGGRSRGWGRSGNYTKSEVQLDYESLSTMLEKDPDELVLDMTSDRYLPAIKGLLSQSNMSDKEVVVVLKVFARACDSETSRVFLVRLLNKLLGSVYLSTSLTTYINCLAHSVKDDTKELECELKCMLKLFTESLRKLPTSFPNLPLPNLYIATTALIDSGQLCNPEIKSSVENLIALKDEMAEKVKKELDEQANKPKRRQGGEEAALLDNEEPPDNFRWLSVIPGASDIHANGPVFFRRNKVEGSYDGPEHYLDVQFRLLREDFIRPLREGISTLSKRTGTLSTKLSQDIRVYNGVQILDPVCTSKGVTHKISFDVSRLRFVRWENSKRLIYGSLLCLSKDNFETFILATVEERKPFDLKRGKLQVRFKNVYADFGKETYEMVETTAYFEAYRHVLEGLQEISPSKFPFKRYIVKSESDVQAPLYLRNTQKGEVTYDMTCIMKDQLTRSWRGLSRNQIGHAVRVLDMDSWPSAEDLELDSSQLKAVQLALTKEFAIIQGPPGTGKTYIGLKVVKVLLHNKRQWERGTETLDTDIRMLPRRQYAARPILVVCYTNHALDQFLEGIQEFHSKGIVRVGGRSQSEKMQACRLNEIKHKERQVPRDIVHAVSEAKQDLQSISDEIETATINLQKCTENIIHELELVKADVMTKEQFESLVEPFRDPYQKDNETIKSVMMYWLNLFPDPNSLQMHSGLFVKPVARFAFDHASNVINLVNPSHRAVLNQVHSKPGLHGRRHGSFELQGSRGSYILIPNEENHLLDTRYSMTILMNVYPMNRRGGPILCFHCPGFNGIQVLQNGVQNGKGVLSVSFARRAGVFYKPLTKAVLNLNKWNFIGASYDHHTGHTRLWHNGKMVQNQRNPKMEIASHLPVYIGSLNLPGRHHSYFKGRVCSLEIYSQDIGEEQIMAIAGIREEDDKKDNDVLFEADAMQEQRMLDDYQRNHDRSSSQKQTLQIADQFDKDTQTCIHDNFKMRLSDCQKMKIRETIKKELSNRNKMTIPEAAEVKNVWRLTNENRWRLYRRWITHLSSRYRNTVSRNQRKFEDSTQELKEAQRLEDLSILENADVIGMTTTGAAKYRELIQKIKPRITIVEEAAEVLESHIVTSLSPGCQHLILIGDHQQLRPSPNVYRLATDYNLDISLFERMFKNGIRIEKLVAQHRMRPEIARMMGPIYKDLENHESVLNLENIKGVTSNIFFIEHTELEELIEEGMSRSNIHEAKYLAALCRYFILQGYEPHQITVLTMYTGQLIQLKKEMPRDFFQGVRICAVDNFQGEENDIILLSLVRSNEEGKIGFLRISNRVCVALSRAKKGFFCIGNLELMCEQKDSLWNEIIDDMRAEGKVGSFMTLMCQNHPKTIIHASKPEDFLKAPEGGCMEPCKARLECGHVCKMSCHPTDPKHDLYKCQENCLKSCERDHKCKQLCYEKCKPCDVYVWKKIPSCGHDQKVPCHMDPKDFKCRASCERSCKQNHKCNQLCYEKCKPCDVYVWKKIPSCGHDQKIPCHMDPKDFKCRASCERSCKQDHKCNQLCYEKCKPCNVYVWKRMPSCGHDQKVPCHMDPKEFKCQKPCKGSCDQGHKCKQLCYEECKPCDVLVRKTMPSCGHDQKVPCHMDPKEFKCQASCSKILSCQHPCQNKCFESCTVKCLQIVPKLLRCGHEKEVECHLKPDKAICTASCKVLLKCNHQCKGNCSECFGGRLHKPCQENCDRTLLCGHTGSEACTNSYTACQKKCEKKCPHSVCKKICAEPCIPCTEPCNWKCEHFLCTKTCSEPCDRPRCNKPCKKKPFRKCYHRCIGMCGEPCPKKCRVCDKDEVTRHLFGDEDKTDARFVEVRPCGHVIEVQAMDMWMDECTSDTLSIIQLKGCPRCKTPITTCKRYGKIIKKTLNDIEKVKVETFVDKQELIKEAHKLKQLISAGFLKYFPEEAKHINQNIDRKDVKSDHLNLYENQIYFMNHLSKLLKIHNRLQAKLNRQPLQRVVVKNFRDSILDFVSKVMAKGRKNFCNQEKDELRDEIHRVLLIFSFEVLRTEMGHPVLRSENLALDSVKETIESGKRIDETTCKRYMEQLEQLHKEFNTPFMSADHFKIEKQKDIVKMIYLTQEHWFKCPEGHIYYTHESGATEKIPCPTCKSTEEDTRQVVADDNQLIDGVDGGQVKPRDAGQVKPKDAGQDKSKGAGQIKSKGAGQVKCKDAGQVKSKGAGQDKSKGAGQIKSKGAGQVKPKDAGQVKSKGAGQDKSKGAGQIKSKGADQVKPKDASQVKPKGAGKHKPKDAGHVKPKDAGQVKPRDSGQVKRKDAKQVKRKDAGQAKLKDNDVQFKRKDSGQVKLPT